MTRKSIYILTFSVFLLLASNCKKKKNTTTAFTPDCSGGTASFKNSVQPLIQANCSTSGCHTNYGSYAAISGDATSIRSKIIDGSMPKSGVLSSDEKNKIICWIDGGKPNN